MSECTTLCWSSWFDLGYVFSAAFPGFGTDERGLSLELERTLQTGLFKAVELAEVRDPAEREGVKSALAGTETKCVFLGGMTILREGLNLSSLDEEARTRAVKRLVELIDDAEDLGAVLFLISSGPDPGASMRGKALDQLRKSASALCQYARDIAADQPITITLEHYDRDVHRRFLLGPSIETAKFARAVREEHPNFGITLDQSHLAQLGETPSAALQELGQTVCHVHLANCLICDKSNPLYGDLHPPFCIDGGEIGAEEISSFLLALRDGGHLGRAVPYGKPIVSIEVRTPDGVDPHRTLEEAIKLVADGCTRRQEYSGRNSM